MAGEESSGFDCVLSESKIVNILGADIDTTARSMGYIVQ